MNRPGLRSSAAFLLVDLLACAPALAQKESTVTVDVDATATGTPLNPVWAYFGYDEANYTTSSEGKDLLGVLARANQAKVHVRTHFLFNSGDGTPSLKWGSTNLYTEDEQGTPIYDFAIIDSIMDATVKSGVFPLFELGFMPKALSTRPDPYENSSTFILDSGSFYPPADYQKWGELVATWAEHARQRYDGDSQTNWIWELWNEPDIGYWKGTFSDYTRLYDHTEAELHGVLPNAPLAAPAIARPDGEFLADFLEHCTTGVNAVTGETGTRLDLVTFHAKGGVIRSDDHIQMDLGNQLRLHRAGFETVAQSAFRTTPILISEADPEGCGACRPGVIQNLDYRLSPAYGAYEVAMMKRSLDLATEVGVHLQGILTWAFTYPDSPYFSGQRVLSTRGIHLPVLNAFKLLGSLRGKRVPASSDGAIPLSDVLASGFRDQPDVDVLGVAEDDRVQVLIWNYHDDLLDAEPVDVQLKVSLPSAFARGVRIKHQRVDEEHGNAVTAWEAMGSPEMPSDSQLSQLREAMESLDLEPPRIVAAPSGSLSLAFPLPRFGLSLLTLTPASDDDLARNEAASCSCRLGPSPKAKDPIALALLVGLVALRRRQAKHLN